MKKNKKWYAVLVSILIIGFLMVLVVWVFNLVIREMQDTKWSFDYMQAYAWAEGAWELALLKIKQNGYSYYEKVDDNVNDYSIILWKYPLDKAKFSKARDPLISYDINSKAKEYNWDLQVASFDIFPLFYVDKSWNHKTDNLKLEINSWNENNLTWNIVSSSGGISWVWEFNNNTSWKWRDPSSFEYIKTKIWDFLKNHDNNYLILMNIDPSSEIKYKLTSSKYFSLPRNHILTTWRFWKYKQNLDIFLDNTEFLWRSRYSIYSN